MFKNVIILVLALSLLNIYPFSVFGQEEDGFVWCEYINKVIGNDKCIKSVRISAMNDNTTFCRVFTDETDIYSVLGDMRFLVISKLANEEARFYDSENYEMAIDLDNHPYIKTIFLSDDGCIRVESIYSQNISSLPPVAAYVKDFGALKSILKKFYLYGTNDGFATLNAFVDYNGNNISFSSPIPIFEGDCYIPIREFANIVGIGVEWNAEQSIIDIDLTKELENIELSVFESDYKSNIIDGKRVSISGINIYCNKRFLQFDKPLLVIDDFCYVPFFSLIGKLRGGSLATEDKKDR